MKYKILKIRAMWFHIHVWCACFLRCIHIVLFMLISIWIVRSFIYRSVNSDFPFSLRNYVIKEKFAVHRTVFSLICFVKVRIKWHFQWNSIFTFLLARWRYMHLVHWPLVWSLKTDKLSMIKFESKNKIYVKLNIMYSICTT